MQPLFKRLLLVAGVLSLLLGPATGTSRASFASAGPTNLDYQTFRSNFTQVVTPVLSNQFDFTPASGGDGVVVSQVYRDTTSGMYAYLYQVQHFSTSSNVEITALRVPWFYSAFEVYSGFVGGPAPVYEITTKGVGANPLPSTFLFAGDSLPGANGSQSNPEETQNVAGFDNTTNPGLKINWDAQNPAESGTLGDLGQAEYSAILVVFSKVAPGTAETTPADTNDLINPPGHPVAYVPAPEPTAMVLWGLGGLGLGVGRYFYRRRQRRGYLSLE